MSYLSKIIQNKIINRGLWSDETLSKIGEILDCLAGDIISGIDDAADCLRDYDPEADFDEQFAYCMEEIQAAVDNSIENAMNEIIDAFEERKNSEC